MANELAQRIIAARQQAMPAQLPPMTFGERLNAALGGLGGLPSSQIPALARRQQQREALDAQHAQLVKSAGAQVGIQEEELRKFVEAQSAVGRFSSLAAFREFFFSPPNVDANGNNTGGFNGTKFLGDLAVNLALSHSELSATQAKTLARQKIEKILSEYSTPAERGRAAGTEAGSAKVAESGITGAPVVPATTDIGKQIQDRAIIVRQFGEGSEQVQAFDEAVSAEGQRVKLSDVGGLRKEFTRQSQTFIKVRDSFQKVAVSAATPSAAGDLAMVFNFMKMLDPGSVVREGEFATAQNAAGVPDRVRNIYNRVLSGERLNDTQRADFAATAERLFRSQLGNQLQLENQFRGIAERSGMDPRNVIVDFVAEFRGDMDAPQNEEVSIDQMTAAQLLQKLEDPNLTEEERRAVMLAAEKKGIR